ncbi:Uncharacterised protein [Yersinia intermedia]|jgi:hypothetical protein|nr:hypothetical protein CH53_1173 [Yersinia intermedia]OVZ75587.1 hypothetical protein CBW55_08485 [Yersinia intermedia]OWF88855.1 hypothetical protein B4916_18785 [Yersinia intermedia]CNI55242.1 Uncharacterised protein [Yersinia intermedia]CNJ01080.1 Uncharacterised protein [Yersinia intermedia]
MASEYFLLKQIEQLLVNESNHYWSMSYHGPLDETGSLKILTQHYNGHRRLTPQLFILIPTTPLIVVSRKEK